MTSDRDRAGSYHDRQGAGASYTLHRSDVHAQSTADENETKVRQLIRRSRRGQLIRRGRVQFKELGAPVDNGEITKMTTTKIGKVQRMVQNLGTQEVVRKKGDGERAAEYATTSDAKDGELLDGETPEQDDDADQAQQPNATVQHGLFGKDLPRCTGRDKATDGFRMLREFVRESESRVQQVKSQVPGTIYGLDYQVSMLDYLMPPRSEYPPASEKRSMSARGSADIKEEDQKAGTASAPASARELRFGAVEVASPPSEGSVDDLEIKRPSGPKPSGAPRPLAIKLHNLREAERKARHCPGRPSLPQAYHRKVYVSPVQSEMRPRPLPIRLPSLANFIAKSEPAMGGRSERGENSHIREMINELLGLDKDKVLKLDAQATQDQGGVRRGRTDMKRKIEKQLDTAWHDRSLLKKMLVGAPGGPTEEGKTEPERAAGASDTPAAAGAEEAAGGGHDGARRKREWTEAEEADAYAKFVALLREPDPTISPVARLRSTLHSYQESRDKNRGTLQSALYSMDADRLSSLKRRAKHLELSSDAGDAKTSCALMRLEAERDMLDGHLQDRMKKQYLWYRDLWHQVRGDKRDLPKVAHFIFDFVKQVLEYGEEFQKEMYFAMLEQIENYEFTAVIASLTVNMISGIEGVTNYDVVEWFRSNRGEVPPEVMELTGKEKDHLGDAPELSAERKTKQSLTFVTELP